MKKLLIVIALFGLLVSCNKDDIEKIPTGNIPDDTFLGYLLSNFDTDLDGAINIKEAEVVKEIDLSGIEENLQSLNGIEYFTSLERLIIKNQPQLDVPDLSKNVALTEFTWNRSGDGTKVVDLSKNINLKTLYYDFGGDLDISKNTALEYLQLQWGTTVTSFKNNTLLKNVLITGWPHGRTMDFSENTLLEDLYILMFGNEASPSYEYVETPLSINNCKNLTKLYLGSVGMRSFVLRQADKLKDVFITNYDSLNFVDLSGATNLESFRLEGMEEIEINISNCRNLSFLSQLNVNKITRLNASGCTALKSFSWNTEYNSRKILKELDFSGCTSLTNITCNNSKLEELNIKGCTSLTDLSCGTNLLTKLDISTCTALTKLHCDGNSLAKLDVSTNVALASLGCSGNLLAELDVSTCKTLSSLSCSDNQLKELDLSACSATLVSLYCDNNMLSELNLSGFSSLELLICEDNELEELDVTDNVALKTFFCLSNNLSILDLHTCHALETAYCNNNENLKTLILYKNHKIKNLNYDSLITQIEYKE